MAGSRIRVYQSALNDVRYLYGAPVRFSRDPKLLAAREKDLEAALAREEALAKARAEAS